MAAAPGDPDAEAAARVGGVMATCELCGEQPDDAELLDHLRVMHPTEYGDGPERWPDGSLVVYDDTLMPGEFDTPTDA